jgi:hypothetical protein
MTYWLNLFTGTTWREFQAAGAKITGFREKNWNRSKSIRPGDIFLCYLVGVKRWVGLLKVTSERFRDEALIYREERGKFVRKRLPGQATRPKFPSAKCKTAAAIDRR